MPSVLGFPPTTIQTLALSDEHSDSMRALKNCRQHTARWTFAILWMMDTMHLEVFALVCTIHMTLVFRSDVRVQHAPHRWAGEHPSRICVFKQLVHIFFGRSPGWPGRVPCVASVLSLMCPACLWKNEKTLFLNGVNIYSTSEIWLPNYPVIHINPCRCHCCIRLQWSASGNKLVLQSQLVVSAAINKKCDWKAEALGSIQYLSVWRLPYQGILIKLVHKFNQI